MSDTPHARYYLDSHREMADDRFDDDDTPQPRTFNRWDAPTPGNFGGSPIYSASSSPHRTLPPDRLGFLPFGEWDEGEEYDEQPPRFVCYTIRWTLKINTKRAGGATAKDLVVAPSEYWEERLKPDLEEMVQTKKKRAQRTRYESAEITVSVNEKNQSKLEQFESTKNFRWRPVERQLCKWSNLLRIGKKLTVVIAFAYRTDDDGNSSLTSKKGEKRGRVSTTRTQLAECDTYIAAEEERTGRPSSWDHVYTLMRCRVNSCPLKSDWCWVNPRDTRHYKLTGRFLTRLVDYVEDGGKLDCHNDVPDDIQQDLVSQSQGRTNSKKAQNTDIPHPININVLPSRMGASDSTVMAPPPNASTTINRLALRGPNAVRKYCKWLELQAPEEAYKADIRRACPVILENLMDLELIIDASNPKFFTEQGIKLGTALRLIRDIPEWSATQGNARSGDIAEVFSEDILE